MVSKFKFFTFLIGGFFIAFTGMRTYSYFFSHSAPSLSLIGIKPECTYAGDIKCSIKGNDNYKVSTLSVYLDDKPLISNFKIGKRNFEYPFTIPSKELSNGKHTLTIEVENGTFNKIKTVEKIPLEIDNIPLQAAIIKGNSDAKVPQGRTLHLQIQANKEINAAQAHAFSKKYPVCIESDVIVYDCYIPVDCDQIPKEYPLNIQIEDKVGNTITLDGKCEVTQFPFKKQSLKIDSEKLKTENESGHPEQKLEEDIEQLTKNSPQKKLWQGSFYTPIEIKSPKQITTEFGVMRTAPHRGLKQHKALDVYTTPRSVVWAPQDGIIVIKDRYAHSGNTVVIDHGYGILTLLFHLDSFAPIEVGQKIKKGSPVGTIGKTGYATGYHLHWEMRINNVAIDPLQWTQANF